MTPLLSSVDYALATLPPSKREEPWMKSYAAAEIVLEKQGVQ